MILDFGYKCDPRLQQEIAFRYIWSLHEIYKFRYKFAIKVLDTAWFNGPVAALKVATGLVNMHQVWVYKNPIISVDKKEVDTISRKDIDIYLQQHNPFAFKDKIVTGIYNNNFASNDRVDVSLIDCFNSIHKNVYSNGITDNKMACLSIPDKLLNIYDQLHLSSYDKILNIYEQIHSSGQDKELNIYDQMYLSGEDKILNVYYQLNLDEDINKLNIYDQVYLSGFDKILNIYDNYNLYKDYNYNTIINPIYNLYKEDLTTNIIDVINTEKAKQLRTNIMTDNLFGYGGIKEAFINKQLYGETSYITANIIDNIYLSKGELYANLIKYYSVSTDSNKYSNIYDNLYLSTGGKEAIYDYQDLGIIPDGKEGFITENLNVIKDFTANTNWFKNPTATVSGKNAFIEYNHNYISKGNKEALLQYDYYTAIKRHRDVYIEYNNLFINTGHKDISIYTGNHFLSPEKRDIVRYNNNYFTTITNKDIVLYKDLASVNPERRSMIANNFGFFITRDRYPFRVNESYLLAYRDSYEISHLINEYWVYRDSKDISLYESILSVLRRHYDVYIDRAANWVAKNIKDLSLFIDKDLFVLPGRALGLPTYVDYVNNFVSKNALNGDLLSEDLFSSMLPKKVMMDIFQVSLDKDKIKAFIDYKNYWLIKEKIATCIYNDPMFAYKDKVPVFMTKDVFAYKGKKDLYIDKQLFAKVPNKDIYVYKELFASKGQKDVYIDKQLFAYSPQRPVALIYGDEFIEKLPKMCYYDKGVFADRLHYSLSLLKQEDIIREKYGMTIVDFSWAEEVPYDMDILPPFVAATRDMRRSMTILDLLAEANKVAHSLKIYDKQDAWVWVYEPPDPFDTDQFGIDELLLPEEDAKYEQFEDLIFNKDTLKPRNPVRRIDDNTWVAKLPIKHPLPERSDVGKYYTGVPYEQYYGVRTSIMHEIYLEFYNIWQANLFKFAAMTMQQAVKTILEYLYSWILITFGTDEIKEAFRVYHQVRWFAEMALLNNSQYIITVTTQDLNADIENGNCNIPNNLGLDKGNDTMGIYPRYGTNFFILKNNPCHEGAERAYVEFYPVIKQNTEMIFNLINEHGYVSIYINDELIDQVSLSTRNYVLSLPGGLDELTVRLEKTMEHNIGIFAIDNLRIKDAAFGSLEIQYDPTLRSGNKPMDEIAKKMIQWANEKEDFDEAYEYLRKGNLGVAVTMNEMIKYWNQHHKDKIKGKRLTIKKS